MGILNWLSASKFIKQGVLGRLEQEDEEESRSRLEAHQSCQVRLCLACAVCGIRGHTHIRTQLHAPLPASLLPLNSF